MTTMADGVEYARRNTGHLTITKDTTTISHEQFRTVMERFCADAEAAGAATIEASFAPNGGLVLRYEGNGAQRANEGAIRPLPGVAVPDGFTRAIRPSWGGEVTTSNWDANPPATVFNEAA